MYELYLGVGISFILNLMFYLYQQKTDSYYVLLRKLSETTESNKVLSSQMNSSYLFLYSLNERVEKLEYRLENIKSYLDVELSEEVENLSKEVNSLLGLEDQIKIHLNQLISERIEEYFMKSAEEDSSKDESE